MDTFQYGQIIGTRKTDWGSFAEFEGKDAQALSFANGIVDDPVHSILKFADRNAIAHSHVSANITYTAGAETAALLGAYKELTSGDPITKDTLKDFWNNEVGRQVGKYVAAMHLSDSASREAIDDLIIDAYRHGGLVVDEDSDPRLSPGISPSWSGPYDSNWQNASAGRDYGGSTSLENITIELAIEFDALSHSYSNFVKSIISNFSASAQTVSPLVLDLNSNGIELTKLGQHGTVYWDGDNDGFREASGWVHGGDGLLVRDINGNGTIDNNSELFGNSTTYANGFLNLKSLDSNSDNKITSADAQWSSLKVWVDANQDGVSQASELSTLSALGITQIDLGYSAGSGQIAGNDIKQTSTFVQGGVTKAIVDAWFATDQIIIANDNSAILNMQVA